MYHVALLREHRLIRRAAVPEEPYRQLRGAIGTQLDPHACWMLARCFVKQCTGADSTFSFDVKGGRAEAFRLAARDGFELSVRIEPHGDVIGLER